MDARIIGALLNLNQLSFYCYGEICCDIIIYTPETLLFLQQQQLSDTEFNYNWN